MVINRQNLMTREPVPRGGGFLDRVFDDVPELLRRPLLLFPDRGMDLIRSDEYKENGNLVVRIELGGIDPDKDVAISITDGVLHISVEHEVEESSKEREYARHELRYRSLHRDLPVPKGTSESDVMATYVDGILEIRVPLSEEAESPARRVKVTRANIAS